MSFKKTVLQLQQIFVEADADVVLVHVDSSKLEPGCEAIDMLILNEDEFIRANPTGSPAGGLALLAKLIRSIFDGDGSGNYWEGYPSDKPDHRVVIGIDTHDALGKHQLHARVEEQDFKQFERKKVQPSFKTFLNEARKSNVNYQEERTKGVVTKVIAELEGHEAGRLTKLAREYHKLSKALDKIDAAKKERNAQLKELIGDTFDPELDKFYTRVLASASFTATLAKETHPDDVSEKVEIAYEKLVDGLMKLIAEQLQPAAAELLEACTRKWKPDPRSPNLSVKPLDEGIGTLTVSMVAGWWRKIKDTVSKHLARFDKGLPKLEKQLEAYKAMPKPSLGVEGAKADRKHPAITTVEGQQMGKFKTFIAEANVGMEKVYKDMASMYSDLAEGSSIGDKVDHDSIAAFFEKGVLDSLADYNLSMGTVKKALSPVNRETCFSAIMTHLGL